jgi:hypothetical protein
MTVGIGRRAAKKTPINKLKKQKQKNNFQFPISNLKSKNVPRLCSIFYLNVLVALARATSA